MHDISLHIQVLSFCVAVVLLQLVGSGVEVSALCEGGFRRVSSGVLRLAVTVLHDVYREYKHEIKGMRREPHLGLIVPSV